MVNNSKKKNSSTRKIIQKNSIKNDALIFIKMKGLGAEYLGRYIELTGAYKDGKKTPGTVPMLKIRIVSYEHPFDIFSTNSGTENIPVGNIKYIKKITEKGDVLSHITSYLGGKNRNKSKRNKTRRNKTRRNKTRRIKK